MNYAILDIETVPVDIANEDVRNYLMDKMISREKRSFDPNYSKIIVIGIKFGTEETRILAGDDEKSLLVSFWGLLKEKKPDVIVTHNGYQFDIPFLLIRSVVHKIETPFTINMNKWSMDSSNHFDTMQFFSHYGTFTNPNLAILAKLHGIEMPFGEGRFSGAEVERLYHQQEWEKIKNHCKEDVELLDKVFVQFCLHYLEAKQQNRLQNKFFQR